MAHARKRSRHVQCMCPALLPLCLPLAVVVSSALPQCWMSARRKGVGLSRRRPTAWRGCAFSLAQNLEAGRRQRHAKTHEQPRRGATSVLTHVFPFLSQLLMLAILIQKEGEERVTHGSLSFLPFLIHQWARGSARRARCEIKTLDIRFLCRVFTVVARMKYICVGAINYKVCIPHAI